MIEVDQHTFRLAEQADGSYSLVRETAAGAIQPIVDTSARLSFEVLGDEVGVCGLTVRAAPTEPLRRAMTDRVFRTSIDRRI